MRRESIRAMVARGSALAMLGAVLLAAGSRSAEAGPPNYATGDMLYVVYSPAGPEIVVDIGPTSSFENLSSCLTLPLAGHPLAAADVTDVLGPLTPSTCFYSAAACSSDADCRTPQPTRDTTDFCIVPRASFFALRGDPASMTSFYASRVPDTTRALSLETVGSPRGAANVIKAFGLQANSYGHAVPSAKTNQSGWAFGEEFSYQHMGDGVLDAAARDNERHEGSLGSSIPVNIESVVPVGGSASTRLQIPIKFGVLDPRDISTLAYGNLGFFEIDRNAVITRFCPDSDGDGIPNDGTDTCPNAPGAGLDTDGDGFGSACDCNNSDSTVWAAPTPITLGTPPANTPALLAGVKKNGPPFTTLTVEWVSLDPTSGTSTNYDVARGLLSVLHAGGSFAGAVCAANNLANTPYSESAAACGAGVGNGCWYLVRGQNSCGTGSYGPAALDAASPCP